MYGTLGVQSEYVSLFDWLRQHGFSQYANADVHAAMAMDTRDGEEHYEHSVSEQAYDAWVRSVAVEALCARGASAVEAGEVVECYREWNRDLHAHMRAFPEALDVMQQVRAQGCIVAVCSNWDWDIETSLDAMGLGEAADFVIHSAQLGVRKPHPQFFARALAAVGSDPDEAMFVGDTWKADVEGARGAGIRTLVFVDRNSGGAPGDATDVHVVPDLRGVLELL